MTRVSLSAKRPRRLSKRQLDKIVAHFDLQRRVLAYFDTLGDLVWPRPYFEPGTVFGDRSSAAYREHVILTKEGPLGVSIYTDWIACVFDDLDAPSASPSGKWNHHAFVYSAGHTDPTRAYGALRDALYGFVTGVEALTLDRPLMEVVAEALARGETL